jgi:hypothetical protein
LIVLVTGSRNWSSFATIYNVLKEYPEGTIVVHGGAPGADTLADLAASELGFESQVVRPDYEYWKAKVGPRVGGRIAPLKRNVMMLEGRRKESDEPNPDLVPDRVEAFRNLASGTNGTLACLNEAVKRDIPVRVVFEGGE